MANTVTFLSLGCDKNLVDSEHMLGLLNEGGFVLISEEDKAEVIIVNTCCFIDDAKQESIDSILEVAQYKKTGNCKALIVTGCMAERYKTELLEEMPEVDAVVGTTSYDKIVHIARNVLDQNEVKQHFEDVNRPHLENMPRVLTTGGYFAYIKIAEGCNSHCTYCIIPSLRGQYRSRPKEKIVEEVMQLAEDGVSEIILVAQNTTMYGIDKGYTLTNLLQELSDIDGIEWIRILYCYPENITDELIEEIKVNSKVCKYLDIPIQHSSDQILKRMNRKSSNAFLKQLIQKLRDNIPNIMIRSTLIVGFPGETEEDFNNLIDFVKETKLDRLGVFTYSQEEGTPAAKLANQIDEHIKESRKNTIMKIQQEISKQICATKVGKIFRVLIEGKLEKEDVYIGRTYGDAPVVDSKVFVEYEGDLMCGDFISVKITQADEYDLIGEVVYEYCE
ncbi:30S ribosomal protein S12 methylthiotransferase RimO [Candidatus Epulonipiscium viviparus]|uniref:30S ribosomal protein S12 methylthiotransferase RimO n=1 Tax=Candidatus Epulonipiscium viviparus TaxID=420336 RepID=UPI00273808EB|nr:30S ribosomal protein S12 methylthiotransferase RimO [Candidatus Epulopiscium viviparus]